MTAGLIWDISGITPKLFVTEIINFLEDAVT
jgi:hypothetical protein